MRLKRNYWTKTATNICCLCCLSLKLDKVSIASRADYDMFWSLHLYLGFPVNAG